MKNKPPEQKNWYLDVRSYKVRTKAVNRVMMYGYITPRGIKRYQSPRSIRRSIRKYTCEEMYTADIVKYALLGFEVINFEDLENDHTYG